MDDFHSKESLLDAHAGEGGTSDMATIEDMENPEEWLTECQAKFGASGSEKIGMPDFQERNKRLSIATCTSSAKSMLLVAASKNANIRVVQIGQLAPFSIAKAKAVCTCFNHHSHRPSLPASSSPWSLKSLKQRVQKESEKEIQ